MPECRACGKEIVWVKTVTGKRMPCDVQARIIEYEGQKLVALISHWAKCPAADEWRKKDK